MLGEAGSTCIFPSGSRQGLVQVANLRPPSSELYPFSGLSAQRTTPTPCGYSQKTKDKNRNDVYSMYDVYSM